MSRASKENYKRVVNKNADKYVGGEDSDLVRFSDQGLLSANATGGSVTVFSDGTNWRKTTDRAIVG